MHGSNSDKNKPPVNNDDEQRVYEAKVELAKVKAESSLIDFLVHRLSLHLKQNNFADRLMLQLRESKK